MGYVINHCIACFQIEEDSKLQKKALFYIAQGVEYLTANTAYIPYQQDFKGGEGKQILPFTDYMEDKPQDERTAAEVVDEVMKNCGFIRG